MTDIRLDISNPRTRCKLQIARQIAISQYHVWSRLNQKQIDIYMTLAENILAAVERSMKDWKWS